MLVFNLAIGIVYALVILISLITMTVRSHHIENEDESGPFRAMENPAKVIVPKELGEFLLLACLYFNVRPRNWPQFFTLEMNENNRGFLDGLMNPFVEPFFDIDDENSNVRRHPQGQQLEASMHASSYECTTKEEDSNSNSFYTLGPITPVDSDDSIIQEEDKDSIGDEYG